MTLINHRVRAIMAGLVATGVLLAGCTSTGQDATPGGDEDDVTFTVGVSVWGMASTVSTVWTEALQNRADEYGYEVIFTGSHVDATVELANVEDLSTQDVDAILLQAVDSEASQEAARRVNEAGIPLFQFSTEFSEGHDVDVVSYKGVDDTDAGVMQAKYLNEKSPDGASILFVAGTYGTSWTDRRKTGFEATINDNIEIVSELQAGCSRDEAQRVMEDMLQSNPPGSIDGAVAQCDESAAGAANAVLGAGREDDFKEFVSVDGTSSGIDALVDGVVTADVDQNFVGQGELAAEILNRYLNGEEVDSRYYAELVMITEENLDEYVD